MFMFFLGLYQPVTGAVNFKDMDTVHQTIQQGSCKSFTAKTIDPQKLDENTGGFPNTSTIRGKKVRKIHTTIVQPKHQIAHKITKIANPQD